MTAPSDDRRSFVRTNAPPLPGLTCWNSRTLKIVPSTSMWLPFFSWLVLIMAARQCRALFAPGWRGTRRTGRGQPRDELARVQDRLLARRPEHPLAGGLE